MAENFLTKQVAGIPVGAWAAVVAGGLGIAYLVNRNQAEGPEAVREPLTEPGVGTGLIPNFPSGNGDTGDQDQEPQTNLAWQNQAIAWLIGQGHDPNVADDAVRKYVTGEELSVQENALIALVLANFGPPPEDVPVRESPTPGPETPQGAPSIKLTSPFTLKAKWPVGPKATGVVRIGGEPPGIPQMVRWDMYAPPPGNRQIIMSGFAMTDTSGNFSVRFPPIGRSRGSRREVHFFYKKARDYMQIERVS